MTWIIIGVFYSLENLMQLQEIIRHHWGIEELRPLQTPAISAVIERRNSLVVLPTGGGKSLCYQAPAVYLGGTTVVISPLISLMKDQVDGLRACGVAASQLDSSQTAEEKRTLLSDLKQGRINLLFVSPERMSQPDFCDLLKQVDVRTFAIDEAHCISHWGHDFRPEYRQLSKLKEIFPECSIHAYTATATQQVRDDIIKQLNLTNAEVLVGNFDRPNLTYRVTPRRELLKQVTDVIARYPKDGGIIYCIRRSDVDELTKKLRARGISALPYHAGLSNEQRAKAQDAFLEEKCNVIVATVAFGMGIDRSNVRYVMHTGMPKSLEHYQQETGRAGRDGLDAECLLFHSGADFFTWKSIIEKSASELDNGSDFIESSMDHLREMDRYCRSAACRHYTLVRYFGQEPGFSSCNACDLCLGETSVLEDSMTVAKKIISCVYRVNQRFGIKHVVSVLRGMHSDQIKKFNHEALSTFGILKDQSEDNLRDWIYQLIGQNALAQEEIEGWGGQTYPILKLTRESAEVLKDQRDVRLLRPVEKKKQRRSSSANLPESPTDANLFEILRALRRRIASEKRVAPYLIFSDATLKEIARVKPSSLLEMRRISGVGDIKLRDYGDEFLEVVVNFN